MKIILLKDVPKIGRKYETKNISDGHAINMLIPKGLAIIATTEAEKRIALEKARDEGEKKLKNELLLKNMEDLDGVTITMIEKASEKGHLFAGIHKSEIVRAIESQTKLQIDAKSILLDKPIKEIGMYVIIVEVGSKNIKFNLEIKNG